MRNAFLKALVQLAEKDKSIVLLAGDLGFSVLEPFMEKFPERYFNMGVAEANMMGVASGLALSGKKPFVYSIIPFVTMRCFEQVRNDVCYQNANVKIVGVGAGFSYGYLGPTHHAIVDIAVMRALPNMAVVCPGDPIEARLATKAIAELQGPAYLRLGKSGEPDLHEKDPGFEIGKAIELRKGRDATLIATGNMLETAALASEKLAEKGVECRVLSMHTVKPIDKAAIVNAARETKAIFSIEEHSIIGGLGSAVAEVLAEQAPGTLFKAIGLPACFPKKVGSHRYLRNENLLSVDSVCKTVLEKLRK